MAQDPTFPFTPSILDAPLRSLDYDKYGFLIRMASQYCININSGMSFPDDEAGITKLFREKALKIRRLWTNSVDTQEAWSVIKNYLDQNMDIPSTTIMSGSKIDGFDENWHKKKTIYPIWKKILKLKWPKSSDIKINHFFEFEKAVIANSDGNNLKKRPKKQTAELILKFCEEDLNNGDPDTEQSFPDYLDNFDLS